MRFLTVVVFTLTMAAVAALFAGCSGAGSQGATPALPASVMSSSQSLSTHYRVTQRASISADLFVDDSGRHAVEILTNGKWKNAGSITNGIDGPDGNWEDTKGHPYVANEAGPDITEYNSSHSLVYKYTAVIDPVDVRTDSRGNVYDADYFGSDVNEFGQKSNTPIATCDPGGFVEGVAIDTKGDVFVAFFDGLYSYVTEYAGSLSGCKHTNLGVTVLEPAGMIFDKNDNLVLCDQGVPAVDVIDPPYNSVSGTLGSGYSDPLHVTINAKNDQAYFADSGTGKVYVLSYPAGKLQATVGSSNGVEDAWSAVDSHNYVP